MAANTPTGYIHIPDLEEPTVPASVRSATYESNRRKAPYISEFYGSDEGKFPAEGEPGPSNHKNTLRRSQIHPAFRRDFELQDLSGPSTQPIRVPQEVYTASIGGVNSTRPSTPRLRSERPSTSRLGSERPSTSRLGSERPSTSRLESIRPSTSHSSSSAMRSEFSASEVTSPYGVNTVYSIKASRDGSVVPNPNMRVPDYKWWQRKKTICGISRKNFWILMGVFAVMLIAGGIVGALLASKTIGPNSNPTLDQTVTTTSVARKPEPTNSNILYKIPTGEWDIDAELDVAEGKCDVEKGGVVECISPMDLPIRITETSNGYGLENKFWAELNATLNPPENNAGLYWFELIDHYNATNEFGPCRQDVNVTLMLGESYRYQLIIHYTTSSECELKNGYVSEPGQTCECRYVGWAKGNPQPSSSYQFQTTTTIRPTIIPTPAPLEDTATTSEAVQEGPPTTVNGSENTLKPTPTPMTTVDGVVIFTEVISLMVHPTATTPP